MKPVYLTVLTLWFALFSCFSLADDTPLLIHASPLECTLSTKSTTPDADLAFCIQQAELGYAQAQFELGNYWYNGVLTQKDYEQALHWYSQASIQGHAQAQLRLGMMFANGEGVPANRSQAFIILKMSAMNGSDDAFDAADALLGKMDAQELKQTNQVLSKIFRRYLKHIQNQIIEENLMPERQETRRAQD